MKEYTKLDKGLQESFPKSFKRTGASYGNGFNTDEALEHSGQCYAMAEKGLIKRFKLIKRNAETYSIPYSLLPVFVLAENKHLVIRAHGVHVIVTGRSLDAIERYLSLEQLLWMKESTSTKDDGSSNVFISNIHVGGEYLEK
ncbi:MAG: hypothetical protein JXR03_18480 [Cyclobacteriaceae bacterium]